MIHELRTYYAMPGKKQALLERFAKTNMRFFEKHGIQVVGFWETEFGDSREIVYLCAFEDLAARERAWAAFNSDPEWLAIRGGWEAEGPVTHHIVNKILKPVPFSPLK